MGFAFDVNNRRGSTYLYTVEPGNVLPIYDSITYELTDSGMDVGELVSIWQIILVPKLTAHVKANIWEVDKDNRIMYFKVYNEDELEKHLASNPNYISSVYHSELKKKYAHIEDAIKSGLL